MYKQHLSNIWSSIHKKVKQHLVWVEKSVAYKKKRVIFQFLFDFRGQRRLLSFNGGF